MEKIKKPRFIRRRVLSPRQIFLLPTLFTLLNMLFGFAVIISSIKGEFYYAGAFIMLAIVCDGLDGRFARMMNAQSPMGRELDSFADLVSFGVAPVVLAWRWGFWESEHFVRVGWLFGFIYLVCATMRLARFNVDTEARKHFVGLPAAAAAAIIASTVYYHPHSSGSTAFAAIVIAMFAVLSALMVSKIKFTSIKDIDMRNPRSHLFAVPLTLFIVMVAIEPRFAFVALAYGYLIGNLVVWIFGFRKKSAKVVYEPPTSEEAQI